MEEIYYITEREEELLTVLGKFPDISMKELLSHIKYKWASTVTKKIEQFKKQGIVYGPFYDVDYGTFNVPVSTCS